MTTPRISSTPSASSSRAITATVSSGKSTDLRCRSFAYPVRTPSSGTGTRTPVTISSGPRFWFHSPSAVKNSFTGSSRRPSGPASSAVAPSTMSTGGVSAEWAATHEVPTPVTWQVSPSFFRQ